MLMAKAILCSQAVESQHQIDHRDLNPSLANHPDPAWDPRCLKRPSGGNFLAGRRQGINLEREQEKALAMIGVQTML